MDCAMCAGDHSLPDCNFPATASRCDTCHHMVFNQQRHNCGNAHPEKYVFANHMATKANTKFRMRVKDTTESDGAELMFLEKEQFIAMDTTTKLLSAATSGIFTMTKQGTNYVMAYESISSVNFSFYIGTLQARYLTIGLRVFVSGNDIGIVNCFDSPVIGRWPQYELEPDHKLNTVAVFALEPNGHDLNIQFKCASDNAMKSCSWNSTTGWSVESFHLDDLFDDAKSEMPNPVANTICLNCNNQHRLEQCNLPMYTLCCTYCLVLSFTGHSHHQPCQNTNKKSQIRNIILARSALSLLHMNVNSSDADILFLENGVFQHFTAKDKLLNGPTEILIQSRDFGPTKCISFKTTRYRRCSVLIAVLDKSKIYRLRFRVVFSPAHGVIVFPIKTSMTLTNGVFDMPSSALQNTVAILGLVPKPGVESIYIAMNNFANEAGILDFDNFNGSIAHIGINLNEETRCSVDPEINGNNANLVKKKFDKVIVKKEPPSLGSFREQRAAASTNIAPIEEASSLDDDWDN